MTALSDVENADFTWLDDDDEVDEVAGFKVTNVTKTSPKSSYNVHMVTAAGKHNLPDPNWDESKVKRDGEGKFAKQEGVKAPYPGKKAAAPKKVAKKATKKAVKKAALKPSTSPYAKGVEDLTPSAIKKAGEMFGPKPVGTGQVAAPPKPLHVNTNVIYKQKYSDGAVVAEKDTGDDLGTTQQLRWDAKSKKFFLMENVGNGWKTVAAFNKGEAYKKFSKETGWHEPTPDVAPTSAPATVPNVVQAGDKKIPQGKTPDFLTDSPSDVSDWFDNLTQDDYDALSPSDQILAKMEATLYDDKFVKKLNNFDAAADEDFNPSSTYTPSAADLAKVQIGYEVDDDIEPDAQTSADEEIIANIDSMDPGAFVGWFGSNAQTKEQWDTLSPEVQKHVRVTAEALAGFFGVVGPKNVIASHDAAGPPTPSAPIGTVLKSMDDMNKDEFESWFFKNFAFDKGMWNATPQASKNKITQKAHDVADKNTLDLIKSWLVQDMTPDQWNSFTDWQKAEIEDDIEHLEVIGLLENVDIFQFLKVKKAANAGLSTVPTPSVTSAPLIELDWDNTSGPDDLSPVMYNGNPIAWAKSAPDGSGAYLYKIDSDGGQGYYFGSVNYDKNEKIEDEINTAIAAGNLPLPSGSTPTPTPVPVPVPSLPTLGPGVSPFHVEVHSKIAPISAIGKPHPTSPDTQFHTLAPTDAVSMQNYMLSSNGKKLSSDQISAVQRYTTSIGYRSTNAVLRNDEKQLGLMSDSDKKSGVKNAVDLQAVMIPLTQNVQVFRGTGAQAFGQKGIKANFKQLKALEGKTLTDKGFISTTVLENPPVSYDYAKKPIQMIVDVPAGSPGAYVSAITPGWSQENELILGAGSSYRIKEVREATPEDKARFGNSGLEHVVHVEIVPTTGDNTSTITSPADVGKTPKPPSPAASAVNVTAHPPGAVKTFTPIKITTTIIHKNKYVHGAVVAFKPASTVNGIPQPARRIVWNANSKKFVTQLQVDDSGNWIVGSAFSKKDAYAKFGPQTGWMAPQPNESALGTQGFNPPLTPKISNPAATPTATPAVTTPKASKTSPLSADDIKNMHGNIPIGMSVMKQRMLFDAFKKESSAGFVSLNTTTDNIFRALKETLDKHNVHPGTADDQRLNLLQLIKIVDSESTSKANFLSVSKGGKGGIQNENFYEKKIVEWLQTPDGKDTANLIWSGAKDSDTVQDMIDNFLKPSAIGVPDLNYTNFVNLNHGTATIMQKSMNSAFGAWTKEQLNAIGDYTGSGYGSINGVLRQDMTSSYKNMSEFTKKERLQVAAKVQSAMKPIPKSITVYRGTGADQFPGLSKYANFDDIKKFEGQLFVDRGFVSTSVNVGKSFAGVKLTIKVPAGTPAAYVDDISSASGEHELLLAAGTKFRVESVTSDGFGGTRVILVVEP